MCVSVGKKCLFLEKFGVLFFLVTPVLRFALLPYCRQSVVILSSHDQSIPLLTGTQNEKCLSSQNMVYRISSFTLVKTFLALTFVIKLLNQIRI